MTALSCPGRIVGAAPEVQRAMQTRRGDCLDNPTDPGWCVWCGQPTTKHWLARRAIARLTTVGAPFGAVSGY